MQGPTLILELTRFGLRKRRPFLVGPERMESPVVLKDPRIRDCPLSNKTGP